MIALSAMDLAVITAGVAITSRFDNTFFPFYYPALLGLSLVFSSRRPRTTQQVRYPGFWEHRMESEA